MKDNLYWSDWEARSILQVDKLRANEEGHAVKNAVLHLYSPMDVRVYHELKQPPAKGQCIYAENLLHKRKIGRLMSV